MEHPLHPRWPQKEPETLQELREHLCSHFDFHFTNPNTIAEIGNVLKWMESDLPQVLSWEGASSFSTLFISFHTGTPFMKKLMEQCIFPQHLLSFLEDCTFLEKTTDQFAYLENIEDLQHKNEIVERLRHFLQNLPTQMEFTAWVQAIMEKSSV